MTIRVVLVDDHPLVLEGLTALLAQEPDIRVEARCRNGEQALRAVLAHPPDVLLLDLDLPDLDGIEVLRRLRKHHSPSRVVLLSARISDAQTLEALRLHAEGIVLKGSSSRQVVNCVRRVHSGGRCIEPGLLGRALDLVGSQADGGADPHAKLSAREREIIRLVVAGLSNKQIASRLFVSEGTVKNHLHHIYEKLEVHGRLRLAAYARENDLG